MIYSYVVCMCVTLPNAFFLSHFLIVICFMSFVLCYVLINCFMFFLIIRFIFVVLYFLLSILRVLYFYIVLCIVCPLI